MYLPRPGSQLHIIKEATATATVTLPRNIWGRDVLLIHKISGGSMGGFCTLKVSPDNGATKITHHGDASGVKTGATTDELQRCLPRLRGDKHRHADGDRRHARRFRTGAGIGESNGNTDQICGQRGRI